MLFTLVLIVCFSKTFGYLLYLATKMCSYLVWKEQPQWHWYDIHSLPLSVCCPPPPHTHTYWHKMEMWSELQHQLCWICHKFSVWHYCSSWGDVICQIQFARGDTHYSSLSSTCSSLQVWPSIQALAKSLASRSLWLEIVVIDLRITPKST